MRKFIPYEKLSKKAKRELDGRLRGNWNGLNPVTRVPDNPNAYNRAKIKQQLEKIPPAVFIFLKSGAKRAFRVFAVQEK